MKKYILLLKKLFQKKHEKDKDISVTAWKYRNFQY